MKRLLIISAFLALVVSAGTANGQTVEKETRDLKGFTKIGFGLAGDLYVNIGPEFKVVLEGEKKYLDQIITEVSGGKLVLRKDNWKFNFNEKVTVYVTMPEIKGLGVSGSGKAEIKDAIKSDNLDLSVSGSGKLLTTDITVSDLHCSISGSGDIILKGNGSAGNAGISVSGSGNYDGSALKIGDAEVHISGSGNCDCNVSGSLKASVSGSGNVTYEGNPKLDAHVSGSGKVRSR
jgi:hypothetical protein